MDQKLWVMFYYMIQSMGLLFTVVERPADVAIMVDLMRFSTVMVINTLIVSIVYEKC